MPAVTPWPRQVWEWVRWPEPTDAPLFHNRKQAAAYLGAWGLTVTHVVLWVLLFFGVIAGQVVTIGVSLTSAVATALLIWMVVSAHRRLKMHRGGTTRQIAAAWWRGPWDPVGRLVWLPVRLPAAWATIHRRRGGSPVATAGDPASQLVRGPDEQREDRQDGEHPCRR